MLAMAPHDPVSFARVRTAPGGFFWWYCDLVDAQGRGLVLIWSLGLPFLAGSRDGHLPDERPSISLVSYDAEHANFYLLQQYTADQVYVGSADRIQIGESSFGFRFQEGHVSLEARLDVSLVGGGRLTGLVRAWGTPCSTGVEPGTPGMHRWAPRLAACFGEARLRSDDGSEWLLRGRAYVDGNASEMPLHALGIERWHWGRFPLRDREVIFYVVEPERPGDERVELVIEVFPDGRMLRSTRGPTFEAPRRATYGLGYHERIQLETPSGLVLQVHQRALVDDGPFYLRFLATAHDAHGGVSHGMSEVVSPPRVDLGWQRPFVRMRTQQVDGNNSAWLPLFQGPRTGRFGRLLSHWLTVRPSEQRST